MQLIDDMRAEAAQTQSMFAAQLLKEDILRLEKLEQLARVERDPERFGKAAMLLGWTQGDLRTFELNPELTSFLAAVFDHQSPQPTITDSQIAKAWAALNKRRMDLLVGCLSRPRID
jgi:hypothetical protein